MSWFSRDGGKGDDQVFLVARLRTIARPGTDDVEIEKLALRIHGYGMQARHKIGRTVHLIGKHPDESYFAHRRTPSKTASKNTIRPRGIAHELKRLEKAAERSSRGWRKAWAATSPDTIKAVLAEAPKNFLRDNVETTVSPERTVMRGIGFSATGFAIVSPWPEVVVPFVKKALAKQVELASARQRADGKKRPPHAPDAEVRELANSVIAAFEALSGERARLGNGDERERRIVDLMLAVGSHYDTTLSAYRLKRPAKILAT